MLRASVPVVLPLVAFVLLLGSPPLGAEDETREARPLSLEEALQGRGWRRSLPAWSWRPGHAELVQERRDSTGVRLVRMNPVTGEESVLADLPQQLPRSMSRGRGVRGIGRSRAARWAFDASGRWLRVVRGGHIYVHDTATGVAQLVLPTPTAIQDLQFSPDATTLSYVADNELRVTSTGERAEPRTLTTGGSEALRNASLDWVYPEEFGFSSGHWWSPTGAHIVWLQLDQARVPIHRLPALLDGRGDGRTMRYPRAGEANPKARLAVTPVAGGDPVWLELGKPEYIVRVAWTPDGARVLVVTMDRLQQTLTLWSADPATGKGQVLFRERDEAWTDAPPAPRFHDNRRFLWRSHTSGSTRWSLVTLDAAGTSLLRTQAITPSGYEASRVLHVDPDAQRCLFLATKHGDVGQSAYEGWGATKTRDARAKRILALGDGGWTDVELDDSGSTAVVTWSAERIPARRVLMDVRTGRVVRELGYAGTARTDTMLWAVPERMKLPVKDGVIHVRLWKPHDLEARRAKDPERTWPLIVKVYGGPGSRTVRDRYGRGPLFITHLTQQGYMVAEIDGRGTGGQSAAFVRSVYGQLGLRELEDQVVAVQALTARPYIDAARVGIWGWSYGGTMASLALTRRSDVFAAGVAVAPVTDWTLYDTIYTERYMGLPTEGGNLRGYKQTSVSAFAPRLSSPLLLLHGLGDDNVHAQNTVRLVEALLQAKKEPFFDWKLYPRRGHGIGGAHMDVYGRMMRWFDRHLRPTR